MPIADLLERPDDLLALEPEELAGPLLQDLIRRSRGDGQERQYLHRGNYRGLVERIRPARLDEVLRAITEAWGWLEREILIAPDPQHGGEWFFVTRRGTRLEGQNALIGFRRSNLLPRAQLHPAISQRVWPAFLRGDYDAAVFLAFREVEVAVRAAAALPATEIGTTLMRNAFGRGAILTDATAPVAEQEALAHLFAGAIGSYKNPQSHRAVNLADPVEAAEIITLASQLLRVVDRQRPVPRA